MFERTRNWPVFAPQDARLPGEIALPEIPGFPSLTPRVRRATLAGNDSQNFCRLIALERGAVQRTYPRLRFAHGRQAVGFARQGPANLYPICSVGNPRSDDAAPAAPRAGKAEPRQQREECHTGQRPRARARTVGAENRCVKRRTRTRSVTNAPGDLHRNARGECEGACRQRGGAQPLASRSIRSRSGVRSNPIVRRSWRYGLRAQWLSGPCPLPKPGALWMAACTYSRARPTASGTVRPCARPQAIAVA